MRGRDVLVTGAGGFIGGHLVRRLLGEGARVRAVDVKPAPDWHQRAEGSEALVADLRQPAAAAAAVDGVEDVFHLAADMGGIGFITGHKWDCMLSTVMDGLVLREAATAGCERFLLSSSACVYAQAKQGADARPLRESDAYPADPEDGYGWAKLFSERLCRHAHEEAGIETRVARLHNVYGPNGEYEGGREKAPAALCRKVAEVSLGRADEVEIWGDGRQERSFLWVEDAVEGLVRLMESEETSPLNLGSEEKVTISAMVDLIEEIAATSAPRRFEGAAPTGVGSRTSDNTLVRERLGWEPGVDLRTGLGRLYPWILEQVS